MCSCFIYVFYLVFVENEGVGYIKMGGEFLLPEYDVWILPRIGQLWFPLQSQCFIVQLLHIVMITLICHTQQNAMCNKKLQHGLKRSYHYLKIVSSPQYFIIVVF